MFRILWPACVCVLLAGCGQDIFEQASNKPKQGIIGKKTQEVGEFDPKAGKAVSDSKIRATDPFTAPLSAYGPALERISKSHIEHAVNLYHATHERYPRDHDEFMRDIIKANNIQLPVLPGDKKYEYDVENHKLVVVDETPDDPAAAP
jgi:hypothetical protein